MIKRKSPLRKSKKLSGYLFIPILLTLMLGLFTTQCKEDDYDGEIIGICPLVIETDPADEAVKVALDKIITATLNERMNPTTINTSSYILMEGTNPISGTVTQSSDKDATFDFTPNSPLKPSTLYTATMKSGVRDPMGNALQRDHVWSFTTIGRYTVALSSSPEEGGTTTGEGTYDADAAVTIKAVAADGYNFVNWTEGDEAFSSNADTTFVITKNLTLVANFTTIKYTVALSSNPEEGGTTTGEGLYDSGDEVTVEAVPETGYTFTNWTEGTDIVSTDAEYKFTITEDRILVANFEADIEQFNVELSSNPLDGGTTSGQGMYDSGAEVTVKAVAATGFTFTNWTEGVNIVSTNADYKFTITKNRTLVANFTPIAPIGPGEVDFGSAADFSILTKSGISSTGITTIEGNIGVSPAAASAITGFGLIMDTNGQSSHTTIPTHVTGKVYASDYAPPTPSKLTVAVADMETAYTTANNLVTPAPIVNEGAGNISGLTLAPGLYKWSTGVKINSGATVTLSGGPNDTWVFQIAQDLTLDPSSQVKLLGGAQAKNITWVVAGQAILNTNTVLYGNILSKTLISLNTGAKVTGGLFAQTAATLNTATVVKP